MGTENNKLFNEGFGKNPKPFFIWLGALIMILGAMLGLQWGLKEYLGERLCSSPFHRVTNRQMSVFLWQFPQFMRAHAKSKRNYLPAFQYLNGVTVEPELAGQFAQAPPKILFLYHVWNRQIGSIYIPRNIDPKQFAKFLNIAEEWKPKYWEDAPKAYVEMVSNLSHMTAEDLKKLPLEVKQSFVGWLNYFQEGKEIDNVRPTYKQMKQFLSNYPEYDRNYWKNVLSNSYLKSYVSDHHKPGETIPSDEVPGFLKAAFYNFEQNGK